ncbi:MAG: non-homologous end-joining DNA ligase [Acidimicrobiales bacterium]|nr:non-homologous end-joining DNA ligase [Acidimicrobiales bacterium]
MTSEIGGRSVETSNRDKIFWPRTGFSKGGLIDYYEAIAETMVPHLRDRPITLRRWPDGVEGPTFFQKNAPKHRPEWITTVRLGDVDYLRLDEPAALVWAANLAAIEIHPGLARAEDLDRPDFVVFDLDPGPPADVLSCARIALLIRGVLGRDDLEAWPKTSGSKGLQLYVPLDGQAGFEQTRSFALAVAQELERDHPDLVVTAIGKGIRKDKVLIDWSQNAPSRTTVAAYSVRALDTPTVSTPVTWDELESALERDHASALRFGVDDVFDRVAERGDLMRPVLERQQALPI